MHNNYYDFFEMHAIKRHQFQPFPYHLVDPSPWPLLTSFALLTFAISAVLYFHSFPNSGYMLTLGLFLTTTVMILWFRDVVTEGTLLGDHTVAVQHGLTLGTALFITSEVFVFVSVFWAYFHSALSPTVELGAVWPPQGIEALDPYALPLLNTVLLLSSGATVTWAHHSLIQGDRKGAIIGNILTVVLALLFTYCQYIEYSTAPFSMSDSVYGSTFYAATGLHAIHVIIGNLFIIVGAVRLVLYHLTNHHHIGYESAILYWQTTKMPHYL